MYQPSFNSTLVLALHFDKSPDVLNYNAVTFVTASFVVTRCSPIILLLPTLPLYFTVRQGGGQPARLPLLLYGNAHMQQA